MSNLTKYLNIDGLDLSYVFQRGTTTTNSGYKLSNGNDLSSVFASGTTYKKTGYTLPNGYDLSTIYAPNLIWSVFNSGINVGAFSGTDIVYTIKAYDSTHIYAGGGIYTTPDNNIAMWDGTQWMGMGGGRDNSVFTIYAFDPQHVFVGGAFTGNMSMWNGSSWVWTPPSPAFNGNILTIYAYDLSNVFVGGDFTLPYPNIAKYNYYSNSWTSITGSGIVGATTNAIRSIVVYDLSHVFVGGQFTSINGVSGNFLMYNSINSSWSSCGSPATYVWTIYVYDLLHVYVGTGSTPPVFGMWNGSTFTILPSVGASGKVMSIYARDLSNVYIGGNFADSIVKYNGTASLIKLGTASNNKVFSISALPFSDTMYIAGGFNSIGTPTIVSPYIVKYGVY
jgi:hypothetical protein